MGNLYLSENGNVNQVWFQIFGSVLPPTDLGYEIS